VLAAIARRDASWLASRLLGAEQRANPIDCIPLQNCAVNPSRCGESGGGRSCAFAFVAGRR